MRVSGVTGLQGLWPAGALRVFDAFPNGVGTGPRAA